MGGWPVPTKDEIAGKNRHVYDETFGLTWRRVVLEPLHGGLDFINIGGAPLIDRIAALGGFGPATEVLDLCSGPGGVACYLAEAYGSTVTGVDMSPCQTEQATARLRGLAPRVAGRLRFVREDILRWVPDRLFHAVICLDSAMLIDDIDRFFRVAHVAARTGGDLLVATITAGIHCPGRTRARAWEEDGMVSLISAPEYLDRMGRAGWASARSLDMTGDAQACCRRVLDAVEAGRELIISAEGEAAFDDWLSSSLFYSEAFDARRLEYHLLTATRPLTHRPD